MPYKRTIIWDWNGTLLDDTSICISAINKMLTDRNLPILTKDEYIEIFTFPVIDYYKKLGFNFIEESWDEAAMEFMSHYFNGLPSCKLTSGAIEVLDYFKELGYTQVILSAMQHDSLLKSVDSLQICGFFDYIGGIENHYASGKIENVLHFFKTHSINSKNAILIGDTLHDAEVADELGCNCILVCSGHQSRARLETSNKTVISSLKELKYIIS